MHALLNPSKAHRWLRCPGSVNATKDIPDTTSEYAEEGTRAHEIAAADLQLKPRPFAVDRETHDYIKVYTDAIWRAAKGDKMLFVEESVDISMLTGTPGDKGTVDALILDLEAGAVEVHDLKFGRGHLVNAENNEQLMMYAFAAMEFVDGFIGSVKTIKLVIHQPRRDHVSEWTTDRGFLLNWGRLVVRPVVDAIHNGATDLHPSEEACMWCPAKPTCKALADKVQAAVFDDFGMTDPPKIKPLSEGLPSPDTIAIIKDWVEAALARIGDALKGGTAVPGWKLVLGRPGNRKWSDEGRVAEALRAMHIKKDDGWTEEVKSVAQLEKSISPKKFARLADYISRSEAQPTAVAASDSRPEYTVASADEFDIFK